MNKELVVDSLVKKLFEAKKAYYTNTPIMTDALFDQMEDDLRKLDPNNKYFSIVGTNVKGSSNIKHKIPMLSCGKAKTTEELSDWMKKINFYSDFVCMPKIDGLSCSIEYVNGKLSCISTRGDGDVGQDITWLKDFLNIPLEIKYPCSWQEVRGEIYLPKDTKLETNGKPLRNIAAGLVNRKDDKTNCEYLKFVAYQYHDVVNVEETFYQTFYEDLVYIRELGFDIVEFIQNVQEFDLDSIREQYLTKWRSEWKYETDGLVFQYNDKSKYEEIDSHYTIDHHNWFRWALKPPSESAITMLQGITWDVSRNGNVIPVAYFEPIYLGNKEIKNATLNNYENVEKLDLHFGDIVEIANSNEVIPFFVGKIESGKGESLLIKDCPCCERFLNKNGVHAQCINPECEEQHIKKLTYYCTKSEMDSVSESTIRSLYNDNLIEDYIDLYALSEAKEMILRLDGFGESKISNLLFQIEKSRNCTIVEFLDRLGIELVGEKAVNKLGIKTTDDFWKFSDRQYVIGQNLIDYRENNKKGIEELLKVMNIKEEKMKTEFKGKVCMTGKGPDTRQILEAKIFQMGYESVDSVNKETSILIVDDLASTSSKMAKAQKLGIRVLKYEEFFK